MNIYEFASIINKDIETLYYGGTKSFITSFKHSETKNSPRDIVLESTYGSGKTYASSINDYTNKIRGKRMIFYATSKTDRQEYDVPALFELIKTEK